LAVALRAASHLSVTGKVYQLGTPPATAVLNSERFAVDRSRRLAAL
jgi:hypothetical protein